MENTIVNETNDILKRLSPKNQTYFMTLVRLAEVAEKSAKNRENICQPCGSSRANVCQQMKETIESVDILT